MPLRPLRAGVLALALSLPAPLPAIQPAPSSETLQFDTLFSVSNVEDSDRIEALFQTLLRSEKARELLGTLAVLGTPIPLRFEEMSGTLIGPEGARTIACGQRGAVRRDDNAVVLNSLYRDPGTTLAAAATLAHEALGHALPTAQIQDEGVRFGFHVWSGNELSARALEWIVRLEFDDSYDAAEARRLVADKDAYLSDLMSQHPGYRNRLSFQEMADPVATYNARRTEEETERLYGTASTRASRDAFLRILLEHRMGPDHEETDEETSALHEEAEAYSSEECLANSTRAIEENDNRLQSTLLVLNVPGGTMAEMMASLPEEPILIAKESELDQRIAELRDLLPDLDDSESPPLTIEEQIDALWAIEDEPHREEIRMLHSFEFPDYPYEPGNAPE